MQNIVRVDSRLLEIFIAGILERVGVRSEDAAETAQHVVSANLRGIDSHGVQRVPIYVERIQSNLIHQYAEMRIIKETPISCWIDGNNGLGPSLARQAMEMGIEKALQTGIGIIGMKNANHTGVQGYYTELAAKHDLIAFSSTNAPAVMPPYGGIEKYFGTNPFSFACPADEEDPFVLYMSTSVVARGKIVAALKNKQTIPLGWALDAQGNMTTDPEEALQGTILPIGGAKGSGLAFMVDILSGILTGAHWGPYIGDLYSSLNQKQHVGQFFFVMRPDLFEALPAFKYRMDQAIKEVRSVKTEENVDRILIPGEMERSIRNERLFKGIPLNIDLVEELNELGHEVGLKEAPILDFHATSLVK